MSKRLHPPAIPFLVRKRSAWLLLLAAWGAIVGLAFYQSVREAREQATRIAAEGARNMFRMVVLTRSWNSSHEGVYVPVTPRTQPNPYLDHPRRDVVTTDGQTLTMVNPAYMTRLIAEIAAADSGTRFRLTSLHPVQPANQPDAWEAEALRAFEAGARETIAITSGQGGGELRYMAPLLVQDSCLKCHAQQGYRVGDIRGGISVAVPYAPIAAAIQGQVRQSLLVYTGVFLLVAGLGWVLLEMLRRRWSELAGMVEQVEASQHQLLQSEKMASVGQLAAGVAHEINNPIGFVNSNLGSLGQYSDTLVGLLEACRAGKAGEAEFIKADFDYIKADLQDLLRESREGLDRVKKIVADLKDFSHVDQAEWQETDLNAGVASTLNVVWHELKYKAEVIRDFGELPRVPCIASQINQVVMNLLVNAAQAIPERGIITLRTGHDAREAWIQVEDTGKGMAPEVVEHIFEPFFTTKPVGQGTGLGLSLSYEIVKRHGGRIEVDSTVGQGSRFTLYLPLHPAHPPA